MEAGNENERPRTRAEAKRNGTLQYFTGQPCVNGHIEARTTSSGGCLQCVRDRKRDYRAENPEKLKETRDLWRQQNIESERDRERIRSRKRFAEDPVARRAVSKGWRDRNIEKERARSREKYVKLMATNPERVREIGRKSDLKRRSTVKGKLENSVKAAVHRGLTKGSKNGRRTFELLGYSVHDLKSHLESKFLSGMTWENYGDWHIDHNVPLSAHNYETPDDLDFKRAWALSNLQPLWAFDNISKHARLDTPFQPSLALAV